jgi:branched-chain amino acid transport system substrate-binding protein
MMRERWKHAAVVALTLTLALAACGGDDDDDSSADGGGGGSDDAQSVTIYSSLPLQGASRPIGEALVNGMRLAFQEAGNEADGVRVEYTSLDDSTAQAGQWTPEAESANARRAIQDDSAVAYLGTFNSGAAAIAIPLLNEAGMAMLSPGNTAVGLTSDEPGANTDSGEPDIYYPTGERNYARIVPKDTVQGAALATIMNEDGCTRTAILHDREVYGAGLAENISTAAEGLDFEIVSSEGIDPRSANYRSVASALAADNIDCFMFSGITANGAVQLYKDISAAVPAAKLYGGDGVAESTFYNEADGGLPADVAAKVKVTVATLSPEEYSEEGRQFFADYEAEYGEANPNPYAIYGYEAARLILDVLTRADDPTDRESVRQALFETADRDSVLGTYSIDENGDTTLTTYGVYRIEGGELVFERSVESG